MSVRRPGRAVVTHWAAMGALEFAIRILLICLRP